ncbi:TRAP transporter large permease [Pseudonocardia sp. C8]|uniref:TRAP transporter large permease n=1 Tax=Pseudonocardia sp. C8 TaxID=2762759 RepID=UPI0016435B8E|nr:TRAP transporter large permease [Pseudonocardia sp. C8]MBC3191799.1 TRAP transporter large permease [Pseudonocardia sp. C8]
MLAVGVIALMFVLMLLRIPVGFAIGISAAVGLWVHGGTPVLLGVFETAPASAVTEHALVAIPLFLLMAQFILRSGVADQMFDAARVWVGRTPAGLGVATTGAGALFAAISGSSTASAATLASTSIPQMRAQGYETRLASGLVAVVGTLAAMIPPSVALILYAILAEQSVGEMLVAGVVPGILVAFAIVVATWAMVWRNPDRAPRGSGYPMREKLASLGGLLPILLLFVLVTGTIFFGVATPTEASALGALGALLIGLYGRKLPGPALRTSVLEAVSTSVMLLMIIVGAYLFSYFLTATQVTLDLVAWVEALAAPPLAIFAVIALGYLVLGFFMDQAAILALTVPIVLPVVEALGFDPVWFGVVLVVLAEIGLVTPPLGLNVFVVARTTGLAVEDVFRGSVPYVVAMLLVVVLFTLVPGIVLWGPALM